MSPKIIIKGPTPPSNRVTITTEKNKRSITKYNVTFRLPKHLLSSLDYPFGNGEVQQEATPESSSKCSSISSDGLSELDEELNNMLMKENNTTLPSTPVSPDKNKNPDKKVGVTKRKQKPSADYKKIPKNILPMIEEELRKLETDDEFAMVDRIVFTLKDPLGGIKIKLPVKSDLCIHFECFDYENFCMFNKITTSTKELTKRNLIKRNIDKLQLKKRQQQQKQQQQQRQPYVQVIDKPASKQMTSKFVAPPVYNCPMYNCPICDIKFPLTALTISDSYNYFVKNTPQETERIELLGMEKYRLVDDRLSIPAHASTEELGDGDDGAFVVLSSDDEQDEKIKQEASVAAAAIPPPGRRYGTYLNAPDVNQLPPQIAGMMGPIPNFLVQYRNGQAQYIPIIPNNNYNGNMYGNGAMVEEGSGNGTQDDPITLD
ncbi:uncharacterized protein J8A68_001376 [[Candida] subhashii]|uniref:SP-RING-type domain-containing protein n=1 Tax=[Candida] subhashii TaxID=561895 RepID=A0A8J5QL30_9ASCO|nr:uncharacterized protein J8A68_001376 [[Candida] subhashii]KAG7665067.1 hypothetical protein J8A68_001376 [[Candida] subhashii]